MADTRRTLSELQAILASGFVGSINAQDIRDMLVSLQPAFGRIYVDEADAAAVTISNTSTYFEATAPAWTLSAGGLYFDESAGNGRITYIGDPDVNVHVSASVSITCASSNQVIHTRLGVSGTSDPGSETQRKIATGSDVGSSALHASGTLSTGDYVSLFFQNETSAANVTVICAHILVATTLT